MNNYQGQEMINIGTGQELSIRELARLVAEVVGYKGAILWDQSKPDGTPRKLLESSKLEKLGWKAQIPLREGIARTYQWYQENR